jgi:hypothetical protein
MSIALTASIVTTGFAGVVSPSAVFAADGETLTTQATTSGPTNFKATLNEDKTGATLKWDAVKDADGYNVYRDGKLISPVTGTTTYVDSNLKDNTTYKYEVSSFVGPVESGKSSVSVKTNVTRLDAVTGLKAKHINENKATITWTAVEDAMVYKVVQTDTGETKTVTGTSFAAEGLSKGLNYTYAVIAVNGGVNSSSSSITFRTMGSLYPAPADFTARVTDTTSVTLQWGYVDVPKYAIYRDSILLVTIANGAKTDLAQRTYFDKGLTAGKTYVYDIVPTDDSEEGDKATVEVKLGPLERPTNLKADTTSDSISSKLTWDEVEGATGYKVYRNGVFIKDVPVQKNLTYTDTGLAEGTSYTYSVLAMNGALEGAKADVTFKTSTTTPTTPTNLKTSVVSNSSIKISWSAVTNATSYVVTVKNSSGAQVTTQEVTTTEYTATGLQNGIVYTFEVSAKRGTAVSTVAQITATTSGTVLAAPTNLQWKANGTTGINLTWTAVSGATSYKIYRNSTHISTATSTSFADSGLQADVSYTYQVSAVQDVTEGSKSSVTAKIDGLVAKPSSFNLLSKTANSITLGWSSVTGAEGYDVYNAGDNTYTSSNITSAKKVYSGTGLQFTEGNLTAGKSYRYYVVARKGSVISEPVMILVSTNPATTTTTPETPTTGTNVTNGSGNTSSGNQQSVNFTDVSSTHYAKTSIERLVRDGVVTGYKDGSFKPNQNVSRVEIAVMISRALDLQPSAGYTTKLKDVNPNAWYGKDLLGALEKGIIGGYSNNTFKPNEATTREQMATMVASTLIKAGKKASAADLTKFKDASEGSAWSKGSLAIAVSSGILGGYADNTLRPKKEITRAEAVVMINRLLTSLEK